MNQQPTKDFDEKIKKETGIQVADEAISEGNTTIQNLVFSKTMNKDKLQAASLRIQMGVERKRTLSAELKDLRQAKIKLSGKFILSYNSETS